VRNERGEKSAATSQDRWLVVRRLHQIRELSNEVTKTRGDGEGSRRRGSTHLRCCMRLGFGAHRQRFATQRYTCVRNCGSAAHCKKMSLGIARSALSLLIQTVRFTVEFGSGSKHPPCHLSGASPDDGQKSLHADAARPLPHRSNVVGATHTSWSDAAAAAKSAVGEARAPARVAAGARFPTPHGCEENGCAETGRTRAVRRRALLLQRKSVPVLETADAR
jgi:hypothetical protein